jgi:hypothetical protein
MNDGKNKFESRVNPVMSEMVKDWFEVNGTDENLFYNGIETYFNI